MSDQSEWMDGLSCDWYTVVVAAENRVKWFLTISSTCCSSTAPSADYGGRVAMPRSIVSDSQRGLTGSASWPATKPVVPPVPMALFSKVAQVAVAGG
jgi:hypothetical protein